MPRVRWRRINGMVEHRPLDNALKVRGYHYLTRLFNDIQVESGLSPRPVF